MANAHSHESHDAGHGSVKSYAIGFILSVILTVIHFGLVMYPSLRSHSPAASPYQPLRCVLANPE